MLQSRHYTPRFSNHFLHAYVSANQIHSNLYAISLRKICLIDQLIKLNYVFPVKLEQKSESNLVDGIPEVSKKAIWQWGTKITVNSLFVPAALVSFFNLLSKKSIIKLIIAAAFNWGRLVFHCYEWGNSMKCLKNSYIFLVHSMLIRRLGPNSSRNFLSAALIRTQYFTYAALRLLYEYVSY